MFLREKAKYIFFIILAFVSGLTTSLILKKVHFNTIKTNEWHDTKSTEYKYISPLLECEHEEINEGALNLIKEKIEKSIDISIKNGEITSASVYFRDLNNGPWFGINENEKFLPSSLLKVFLLVSVFEKAQADNNFLNTDIVYEHSNLISDVFFKPEKSLTVGEKYSIDEIVEHMIIHSDNEAALLLIDKIGTENFLDIYRRLGLRIKSDGTDFMTTKEYSTIFRILYNSSYLNRQYSEKALEVLSRTKFNGGIVAEIPRETIVAHKFGESTSPDGQNHQLHDCGIIYNDEKPYLLCVMSRGKNFKHLSKEISNISKIVFEEITAIK